MSVTSTRCAVCNELSHGQMFCSQQCKDEYDEVSERLWEITTQELDDLEYDAEEGPFEEYGNESEPYLDDYYSPYKREWLE